MAIKNVSAEIDGSTYNLENTGENQYTDEITAVDKPDTYDVTVRVLDDAGNEVVIDSTDEKFGKNLKLNIKPDPEKYDLRQVILTNPLGDIMLDKVATIYNQSKLTLYVFQAMGITLSKSIDFMNNDLIAQIFPQTATWGLPLWEEEFGIVPDSSLSIENRRNKLCSIIYKHTPMTPYRIKQLVKGITGFECTLDEYYDTNTLLIAIQGYYLDLNNVYRLMDEKLPAHLNYIVISAEKQEINTNIATGFTVTMSENFGKEVLN